MKHLEKHVPGGVVLGATTKGRVWLSVDGKGIWMTVEQARGIAQGLLTVVEEAGAAEKDLELTNAKTH